MEKVLVYVAGPFRAKSNYKVQSNVRVAEALSVAIANTIDGFPVCPHTMSSNLDGAAKDMVWLEGYLELMRRCDAVLVCPDYKSSSGTKAEIAEAERLGIPIYYAEYVSDDPQMLPYDLITALGGVDIPVD